MGTINRTEIHCNQIDLLLVYGNVSCDHFVRDHFICDITVKHQENTQSVNTGRSHELHQRIVNIPNVWKMLPFCRHRLLDDIKETRQFSFESRVNHNSETPSRIKSSHFCKVSRVKTSHTKTLARVTPTQVSSSSLLERLLNLWRVLLHCCAFSTLTVKKWRHVMTSDIDTTGIRVGWYITWSILAVVQIR